MKRLVISMFVAMLAIETVQAQQIAVVTGSTTKMCQTLKDAIEASSNGSVIYLPGGGFQISDDVRITKKVSIIGIGHKAVSENADGNTVISGNLYFNEGSDGSAVMGCYISGTVYVGYDKKSVNNILIKLCNLNQVYVYTNLCTGTIVNQNYIRSSSYFGLASGEFTNNVAVCLGALVGGTIENNIFTGSYGYGVIQNCDDSTISNNILLSTNTSPLYDTTGYLATGNMTKSVSIGDDPIFLKDVDWNEAFVNYNNGTVSPASDFHFKGKYEQYSDCGIYGGKGFDKDALPPVPYIVNKNIASQTDASGKLNIQIRVKAGQ